MKSRLHKIEIQNFKAFRKFSLNLEGRHLLVYGANGAGKSSLYWALYTFLHSASKPTAEVSKYFDPAGDQKLLNLHQDPDTFPGEIALTLREAATNIDTTYRISHADHGTRKQPQILKGNLASDFITYRFFFGFSDFRNSEAFNIWPLFEKEILPFCVSTGAQIPIDSWKVIRGGNPNPMGSKGLGGTYAYDSFKKKTVEFAEILPGIIDSISAEAQKFYDTHFAEGDPAKVNFVIKMTRKPEATGTSQHDFKFHIPVVEFGIQIDEKTVTRPQAFLNEAKLTQLALSVRFAASMVNLHESDLKLLVLDDLLVSLDMDNRMKVVEILLSEAFTNYQKIILTHDMGFFQEFRRIIGPSHPEWYFVELTGDPTTQIRPTRKKSEIQKAEDYLHGHSLDEAAVCLRKAAEHMGRRYREWSEQTKLPPGEFFTLTENLRAAKNKLLERIPTHLYERVLSGTTEQHREHLIAASDDDIDALPDLAPADRGKLKTQRRNLRNLLTDESWKVMENIRLIDEILNTTERVLNPAAHGGESPLYEHEVQKALTLLQQLESLIA